MLRYTAFTKSATSKVAEREAGMKQDGRLVRAIHVLVHMSLLGGRETSETIGLMLNTNPVVVRRMMGLLKAHGIVKSEGGRGGGWTLEQPLSDLTILDVQRALTQGPVLTPALSKDHPVCPVERAANTALARAFDVAEDAIKAEFSRLTLSEIATSAIADQGAGSASR
jgi:DNA-binding IscR family transcriptional regulator